MKYFAKALAQTINEKDYTIDVVMSAETTDRQNDIVNIETMSFVNFLNNPVLLPFHDYGTESVGRIEKMWIGERDGVKTLEATIKFAVEEYDRAKVMFNLYKGGFMNAFSIGFSAGRAEYDNEKGVRILYDCELLELSCVSVPANQLALAKSKGLDVKPLVTAMSKTVIANELKELMLGIKELTEDISETPKTPETPENKENVGKPAENTEKQEENTQKQEENKENKENEVKSNAKLKHEILKRALEKAIRSL